MKINLFCCLNDSNLRSLPLFDHSNIRLFNLRSIHDMDYFDHSIVLLFEHSTNHRAIRYIRKMNVLTPIYLVSSLPIFYKELNGTIHPNHLTYDHLASILNLFPQQFIWNYVFQQDTQKRHFMLQNQSLA